MYKKQGWIWSILDNQLNAVIWLHYNKRDDFPDMLLYIAASRKCKIYDFLVKYNYYASWKELEYKMLALNYLIVESL